MEVVSPRLDTTQHVSGILSDFWEAMRVHFNPQKDISCGGHVHVTPLSLNNKFSLRSLRKIAFAAVVYEDFVASLLPQSRRENKYCLANSRCRDSGLHEALLWGKSPAALKRVASDIKSRADERELYFYMQGSRYVLWNFQNTFPHPKTGRCTGTVEFRGGNQFLSTNGTLAWVAFVLGFITLALQEVSMAYQPPRCIMTSRTYWLLISRNRTFSRTSRHPRTSRLQTPSSRRVSRTGGRGSARHLGSPR